MATWVGYPRSYTPGRARPVQYVVIHSTEGSEGTRSAEDGAAYDKRRTDGTSTHLFVDADTALREVPDGDRAHHARHHGNEIGVGIELCGRAGQTDAQWHDASSLPMLRLAAREVAAICRTHSIPVRRLSVAEVRAAYYAPEGQRPKGICGHYDVTRAYPEDQGSHTDPGPNFPWDEFLSMVRAELDGGDDVITKEDAKLIADAVLGQIYGRDDRRATVATAIWEARAYAKAAAAGVGLDAAELAQIQEAARAGVLGSVDELVAAITAKLPDTGLTKDEVVTALREVFADAGAA